MAETGWRAAIFAVIGIGMTPGSAFAANGLAEDARQLYWGELTSTYSETMGYLEKKNTKAGAVSIEELKQLEDQLLGNVYKIQESAKKLSPALGDAWGDTLDSVEELVLITGAVKVQIGKGKLPLDQLKAAYDAVGTDLEKSNAAMVQFGKDYAVLLEWAQKGVEVWDREIEPNYPKTVEYLENENYEDGEDYLYALKVSTSNLYDDCYKANDLAERLAPRMAEQWSDSMVSSAQALTNEVGYLQLKLGNEELSFDNLESAYEDTAEYLDEAYAETRVFGDEYAALCQEGCE